MNESLLPIELPSTEEYRKELLSEGFEYPLGLSRVYSANLLSELPAPPSGKTGWPWTVEYIMPVKVSRQDLPKVTIVTPSYNQGEFIEETIRSVLLQNYPNIEYIIMDGGSTDETIDIVEKYKPWISMFRSAPDRGQSHAINLGFSMASGQWLGWLNSDDLYLPGAIGTVVEIGERLGKDIVFGDSLELEDKKKRIIYKRKNLVLDRYLAFGAIVDQPSTFWRSTVHKAVWESLGCAMDAELWRRLFPGNSRYHIRKALSICRVQEEAKTVNNRFAEVWRRDYEELIWKAYKPFCRNWPLRVREFRLVQWIYRSCFASQGIAELEKQLNRSDYTYGKA